MNSTRKTLLVVSVLIIAAAAFYFINSSGEKPTFYESDGKNVSLAAYQDKDKANDEISNSRRNILTETVPGACQYICC